MLGVNILKFLNSKKVHEYEKPSKILSTVMSIYFFNREISTKYT
jgi:hypothetical protein